MYKVKHELSPSIMRNVFPSRSVSYNLRRPNDFESVNVRTVHYGTETISYRGPKIWRLLPNEIKNAKSLIEFKRKIRLWQPICDCRLCKNYVPNIGFL